MGRKLKKKIKEKIKDCLQELCTDKYKKGLDWNGYEVLEPDYTGTPYYNAVIGPPWVILIKGEKVKISEPNEAWEYLHFVNTNFAIMTSEPSPELTPIMVEKKLLKIKDEQELAKLYAIVHNKAWWIEDEVYDYNEDTKEYNDIISKTEKWFSLVKKLENKILEILCLEDVKSINKKTITPFMERNGYKDGRGWWVKK